MTMLELMRINITNMQFAQGNMMRRHLSLVGLVVATAIIGWQLHFAMSAFAQSSSRVQSGSGTQQDSGSSSRSSARTRQTFESRFWVWLQGAKYKNWSPMPGQTTEMYPGESPHGVKLKTYVNRLVAGNPKNPPHGSIIVKENFSTEGELVAITAMYRVNNYDPEHNDWYWVKYSPTGEVARTTPEEGFRRIAGRYDTCYECHKTAKGGDYLFSNGN
ncbi:hypothetical protein V22_29630 [Calycomorphotria hydatis]|uniref:Cytochrome P460 domain-containing protein n=2 Tax=Calycomorphotria hydatis TaxID=2528027 RepID=A0A517TBE8_9PLAN|nr:hypothetical protein V22_29630 [Calycomorphotria hydatis]